MGVIFPDGMEDIFGAILENKRQTQLQHQGYTSLGPPTIASPNLPAPAEQETNQQPEQNPAGGNFAR